MKMMYGGTPINSMKVKHYEVSTQDCTAIPSDLQAGVTCVSKGRKITGTGKSFEFANYGQLKTNVGRFVPNVINVIEIASMEHPIKLTLKLNDMKNKDFSVSQDIGIVSIDGVEYALVAQVVSNILTISCEQTFYLQVFYGKDNYA